jgi:predicted membrane protein
LGRWSLSGHDSALSYILLSYASLSYKIMQYQGNSFIALSSGIEKRDKEREKSFILKASFAIS